MSLLLLAMLAQPDAIDKALDRYKDFAKRAPVVELHFSVEQPGAPKGTGTMYLHRGRSIRLDGKWRNSDYTFITTKGGMLRELERSTKVYDEIEKGAPFGMPPSGISSTPGFIVPHFLASDDLRAIYGDAKKENLGSSQVGGRRVDTIRFTVMTQMGPAFAEFSIDDKGLPVQVARYGGNIDQRKNAKVWRFSTIKPIAAIPPEKLRLEFPNGYVPHRLHTLYGPLAIGQAFPFSGWTNGRQRLNKGSDMLLAVLGNDCAPSRSSLSALQEIGKSGTKVVLLTDASSAAQANGRFYDPTGKSLSSLSLTATPTFFRVGKDGKITHLWMGYDPAKQKEFVRDVVGAPKEDATE